MWIGAESCLSSNNIVFKCIWDESRCCQNLLRLQIWNRKRRGCSLQAWHQQKSAENRWSWSLLLQCFPIAWDCSIPNPSWELIIMGSLCGCHCPSSPTEYNHMNQGWVAEQSTAEEMKDAWVVVAIVHLIRTEVLIQSEQTQEVVLIKL